MHAGIGGLASPKLGEGGRTLVAKSAHRVAIANSSTPLTPRRRMFRAHALTPRVCSRSRFWDSPHSPADAVTPGLVPAHAFLSPHSFPLTPSPLIIPPCNPRPCRAFV